MQVSNSSIGLNNVKPVIIRWQLRITTATSETLQYKMLFCIMHLLTRIARNNGLLPRLKFALDEELFLFLHNS